MRHKKRGFTLLELTIVLAILAVIAAIVIPMFMTTTYRARLRGDIQSARVIQNAMDLYRVERGQSVAGATMALMIQNLSAAGYIDARNAVTQSQGAMWIVHNERGVIVDITASPQGVRNAFANLTDEEKFFVHGGGQ